MNNINVELLNEVRKCAEGNGIAIAITKNAGLLPVIEVNNNSICDSMVSDPDFRQDCEKYCGRVFEVTRQKPSVDFECHAGLRCKGIQLKAENGSPLAAIVGRAFTTALEYRKATERAISGKWSSLPPSKIFKNILLLSSDSKIESVAAKLQTVENIRVADEPAQVGIDSKSDVPKDLPKFEKSSEPVETTSPVPEVSQTESAEVEEFEREQGEWRRFFANLSNLNYRSATFRVLEFVATHYNINSAAWLENEASRLRREFAIGSLENQKIEISLASNDERLREIFSKKSSIELRQTSDVENDANAVRLFPIVYGGKIRSALVIGEKGKDADIRKRLTKFCQLAASELEVLRLRELIMYQRRVERAVNQVNRQLTEIDSNEFWEDLMQMIAELVSAERGSMLVYENRKNELVVRAAFGKRSEFIWKLTDNIGKRIASKVWKSGKPVLVQKLKGSGINPAPGSWEYKTESFICFPLSIGTRMVGLINLADKIDGGVFDTNDLSLLKEIAPQLAVAVDRHILHEKAGKFEQLSVTDPLTGLLNRRYLEERLNEEISRSDRHGYPMSFLMLDVDDFKSYNDQFTHPEGDKALQLVAKCIKDSLRDADVAARYGGEEFSILLPHTNLEEARVIAERIRNNVEKMKFPNRAVTVSIGITGASSLRDSAIEIISAADKALFEAKKQGRNCVRIYEYERKNMAIE